ncbi:uncharacterized protein BO80DRAFT_463111 [Aspergillus ibericus CBS 121593]|uniref:GroES-like protein n=1 Tax=Aspergillus ibericus CBS 121593 TaxID=1448316 RepID=A0A395H7K8_9EURO|nr:hypothetical protein BO80DRAFT_463111 [Aspergillus ibericus CBS 121593]RAL02868.1 hypothetical protein BO80DRAFT_463111 [Aspergillus ibericus CBS 121593]
MTQIKAVRIVTTETQLTTELRNESLPSPGQHEVLIRVHAVSLNYRDGALLRRPGAGNYLVGGEGCDAQGARTLDIAGEKTIQKSAACTKIGGLVVLVGIASGGGGGLPSQE